VGCRECATKVYRRRGALPAATAAAAAAAAAESGCSVPQARSRRYRTLHWAGLRCTP